MDWPPRLYFASRGALAQLGERLVCNQEVAGSIPVRSMNQIFPRCADAHCDVRSALLLQRRQLTFRIVTPQALHACGVSASGANLSRHQTVLTSRANAFASE